MKPHEQIRQLYRPSQPTVSATSGKVMYHEFLPALPLQSFIYCYWQLKTTAPLDEPFVYRVVADGCIDIFFELSDPADSYIMGFCRKFTSFELEPAFNYTGIRFLPAAFPQLFRINAKELRDRYLSLADVTPATSVFISDQLQGQPGTETIRILFDHYFLRLLSETELNYDNRFYEAMNRILQSPGTLNIETELDTGISPRQLRRLFDYYIGDSAGTFARVVRFQYILQAKPSIQSLKQNKLFFDAGYYDQAHFIKEFKNFYGVTPGKAFGR